MRATMRAETPDKENPVRKDHTMPLWFLLIGRDRHAWHGEI
jgi:hypothetical protein